MISLAAALDAHKSNGLRLQQWYSSFVSLFAAVESVAVELTGEPFLSSGEGAKRVREHLGPQSDPDEIKASGNAAEGVVQQLIGGLLESRTAREKELKKIISITAEAGAVMAESGKICAEELRGFATQIQAASNLESVVDIRRQMTHRLSQLNQMAMRIQQESEERAEALAREIQRVQERLVQAESLAETDALTGLGNRRQFERQIANHIAANIPFCVVVMDLDGFKGVNDRYGHAQGDRLLKSLASALAASIRDSDCVGRWGGDEFVLLLHNIGLSDAEARVSQIQRRVFGEFVLDNGVRVVTGACFGIAEHRPGESAEATFERADRNLYHMKRARKDSKQQSSDALPSPALLTSFSR